MTENLPDKNANQNLQYALQAFNEWLRLRGTKNCHRQIVSLYTNSEHVLDYMQTMDKYFINILYVGNSEIENVNNISLRIDAKQYKTMLGQQVDALIFDARLGVNLNALIATIGLINHSGICLLILPDSNTNDSFINNSLSLSFGSQKSEYWFNKKLDKVLNNRALASIDRDHWRLPLSQVIENSKSTLTEKIQPSTEQQRIITFFTDNISEKHTLIVMGARGRGKSTLLGLLHAPAVDANLLVYICAPSRTHAKQFYNSCSSSDVDLKKTTKFIAPEDLVDIEEKHAVLFIDEMASIAPEFLKDVIKKDLPIVMTGTNIGYEGSAKGFVQRLLPSILNESTSYVHSLNTPFRWYKNDPLESFTNTLLADNFRLDHQKTLNSCQKEYSFYLLEKSELVDSSDIYEQVFGLLSLSHYQTNPNDIIRMMDSTDHQIFICTDKETNTILAVACVILEGVGNNKELADDISKGKRRVQGHMTPQALSYYTFSPQYCDFQYYRISRITVRPNARRQGIASRLLLVIKSHALSNDVSFLSTSFGYTSELFKFWQQNKFTLSKVGHRIDSASSSRSIMMLAKVHDTMLYPKILLDMRILMDIRFLKHVDPNIDETLNELENLITKIKTDSIVLYAKQICLLYFQYKMKFKQIAFAVLYLATDLTSQPSNLADERNETFTLLTLFNTLIQKNHSKEKKLALENELKLILKKQLIDLNIK